MTIAVVASAARAHAVGGVVFEPPGEPGGGGISTPVPTASPSPTASPRPTPTASPRPSVTPTPRRIGTVLPPAPPILSPLPRPDCANPPVRPLFCPAGARRVDETATRLFNTVLQRGCGRFVIHHESGNALLKASSVASPFPQVGGKKGKKGAPAKEPAWVLALVGCGVESITSIEVAGGGVAAARIDKARIDGFRVPLSPGVPPSGPFAPPVPGRNGVQAAFVRFAATENAAPATDREITIRFDDGTQQKLVQPLVVVARNGSGEPRSPAKMRWEAETALRFEGQRIGNAAIAGPRCLREHRIVSSTESSLELEATTFCPRDVVDPETNEPSVVNEPSCTCTPLAYDRLLSIYFELPKEPFGYFSRGVAVEPNVDYLASKPGLIGDSLSHGFYGGALKPDTQLWAYPHLVVAQMGGTPMSQHLVRFGPGLEDAIKTFVSNEYGETEDPVATLEGGIDSEQREVVGLLDEDGTIVIGGTSALPRHAGAAGMDYTNVLRTSGRCLDEHDRAGPDPFPVEPSDEPDLGDNVCSCPGGPEPVLEMQLALACGEKTPIEIMEETKPTFVFASAAGNHFLSCAVHTKARDCVEMDRFLRDSSEVFRRLRRIDSVRGGVVFGVPPLAQLPFLDRQTATPRGLRAFWKRDGEATAAKEVLDADEQEFLGDLITRANEHLRDLAELNGYAYVDAESTFTRLAADGVRIVDPATGSTVCRAKTVIPKKTLDRVGDLFGHDAGNDAGCGIFSLDGIHPNELGHALMANEIIGGINAAYGTTIPKLSSSEIFEIWERDTLNQDPVDIEAFTHEVVDLGCIGALALELTALGITAPVCTATSSLCLESVGLLGLTTVTGAGCAMEAILREVSIRPALDAVDRQHAPAFCWNGSCTFENVDGENTVEP